jgi:hypothetical protein
MKKFNSEFDGSFEAGNLLERDRIMISDRDYNGTPGEQTPRSGDGTIGPGGNTPFRGRRSRRRNHLAGQMIGVVIAPPGTTCRAGGHAYPPAENAAA